MNGTFDEEVKAAMRLAKGETDLERQQNARDQVARRMNVAAGNGMSTAYPNAASPAQAGLANAQQMQQSNVPIPTSRPSNVNQSIDAQLADVPVPSPRPNVNAVEMGDGNALEAAMQGQSLPQTASPNAFQAMLSAMQPQQDFPQPPAAQSAAPSVDVSNPSGFAMLQAGGQSVLDAALALGGAAGLYAYINRAKLGDEGAARVLSSYGIDPNSIDVSKSPMDFGTGQGGGTVTSPAQGGQPISSQQSGGNQVVAPTSQDTQPQAPSRNRIAPQVNNAPVPAPMQQWFDDMQNSIPKVKPKVKAKVK